VKRLAIAFIGIVITLSCSTTPPVAATLQGNSPLTAEYTLQYTIEVRWHGDYYPGETAIHVELADIPVQTDYQQVQATLDDGSIENVNGRETWVIDTTDIYTTNTFTGTFVVRVNVENTPAVPHEPLTPVSGMDEYLSPDNYVTLSADVVSQARQLVNETENDAPKIITKFVDWIQKNITYSMEYYTTRLTDSQVLNIRAGVCKDFSTLFIGFCRATGIPARYVLGYGPENPDQYLYKNIDNTGHVWAEVWIPNYGWLTVDPTWAEIGNDAQKITTSREYAYAYTWQYSNAPPGSGITDFTYSITLADWRVIGTATPSTLTKEGKENVWEITVKNNSPIPLLDNVTVEKNVLESLENWEWSGWFVVSNELIFMNPQETYTFSLDKESGVGYFVWTAMAENGISMWQYPGATPTTTTPTPTTTTNTPTTTTTAPPTTTTPTMTTTTPTPTTTTPSPTTTPTKTTTAPLTTTTTTALPVGTTWVWVGVGIAIVVIIAVVVLVLTRKGK
jgi:transglutaminase-like putative cysteine protease